MTPKIIRRTIAPLLLLAIIALLVVAKQGGVPKDAIYSTSTQFLDNITHFTLTKTVEQQQQIEQIHKPKPQGPKPEEKVTNDESKPKEEQTPEEKEKEEKEKEEKEKEEEEAKLDPCTVINPFNKGFIDLRSLSSITNEGGKALPWNTRGWDSGKNYTIGICSTPFKKARDDPNEVQDGLNSTRVGAFYVDSTTNKFISMGEFSTTPKFRGRKLTLTYENGAYCDNLIDGRSGERLRKSTILTFTCDREMMAKASISFVGSTNDCNYLFEVRSHHACPTAAKANNFAVIWIFLFILLAALFVYFSGGLLYRQMKQVKQSKKSPFIPDSPIKSKE
ncbi:mannose-6-phosphate receptor binding domain-containing protein [Scheffersomyces xylosifermentans]|uniref:mannose-6-phosphate receptor binding domain-containing protein n=1 Tax=Scheffersomyces xylosifermentans TaxID=1304137 RepID=UPI00315CE140